MTTKFISSGQVVELACPSGTSQAAWREIMTLIGRLYLYYWSDRIEAIALVDAARRRLLCQFSRGDVLYLDPHPDGSLEIGFSRGAESLFQVEDGIVSLEYLPNEMSDAEVDDIESFICSLYQNLMEQGRLSALQWVVWSEYLNFVYKQPSKPCN